MESAEHSTPKTYLRNSNFAQPEAAEYLPQPNRMSLAKENLYAIDLRKAALARPSRDLVAGTEIPILWAIFFIEWPSICPSSTTDRSGAGSWQIALLKCLDLSQA